MTGVRQRHHTSCRKTGRCECPWQAEVFSRREGKKIRKQFPSYAAAAAWRDDTRTAVRQRRVQAPTAVTLAEAAEKWLAGARAGTIRTRGKDPYKPATIRSYEQTLDLRVLPTLGRERLSEISRNDLQDLVDDLVASGFSASTVGTALLPVRAIFRRAVSRGEVAVNPTTGVDLPAVRGGRDRIATPEDCAKLLQALRPSDRALWATAMFAGLRRGELIALRTSDIDLASGIITVKHGWDRKEGLIDTKNRQTRKVPIAAVLRDYLDQHLLSVPWHDGYVFGVAAHRPFTGTATITRAKRAWAAAGLAPIGLHECRHTYASLMIAAGVNAKALSTYMGHSTIGITLDRYGHLMPGNETEAAGLLDAYLARSTGHAVPAVPVSCQSRPESTGSNRTPPDQIPHG